MLGTTRYDVTSVTRSDSIIFARGTGNGTLFINFHQRPKVSGSYNGYFEPNDGADYWTSGGNAMVHVGSGGEITIDASGATAKKVPMYADSSALSIHLSAP